MTESKRLERMRSLALYMNNIPTLPAVMSKIIELVEDPKTTAPQLARFISNDPSLTAKILKLANSAFYGFPQKIGTINLAIVVLGFQSVKDLGLSAAVVQTFRDNDISPNINLNKFWVHSIAVSAGCKIIAAERQVNVSGEIFVAGLLHDIGKLVLSRQLAQEYDLVIERSFEENVSLEDIELQMLGFTHADVSGWLADKWNLPTHIVNAVYDYAQPWTSNNEPNLSMIVHFSNVLALRAGYSIFDQEVYHELQNSVKDYLKLKTDEAGEVKWTDYLAKLAKEMDSANHFLQLLRDEE